MSLYPRESQSHWCNVGEVNPIEHIANAAYSYDIAAKREFKSLPNEN